MIRETGTYQTLGGFRFFIPHPLPPDNPPFNISTEIMNLCAEASFILGQLNGLASSIPDSQRFIRAYVIKEALLSSAIENINTTLIDVFTRPFDENKPNKETQLVMNYTKALDVGIKMIKEEGLPITSKVILAMHEMLMSIGDGDKALPGQYRNQAVRVGNLIPAPAPHVPDLIADLEKYINESKAAPDIIKAGLAHVQFETIHPFLDGNGRIGRLLIVLMLINNDLLHAPILYPSYYFKKHRFEYYQRLDKVRSEGDFEGWILYYLHAIKESALDAYCRAKDIEALDTSLQELINKDQAFAKIRETTLLALSGFFKTPVFTVAHLSNVLGKAYNTADSIITHCIRAGFIVECHDQKRRAALYKFEPYIQLLEKEY
jgi:Fic family protein